MLILLTITNLFNDFTYYMFSSFELSLNQIILKVVLQFSDNKYILENRCIVIICETILKLNVAKNLSILCILI